MLDTMHPDVDIIWNIWPLTLIIWWPIRVPLNFLFAILYVPLAWTWYGWDLFWETITGTIFGFFMGIFGAIVAALGLFWWTGGAAILFGIGAIIWLALALAYSGTVTLPTFISWILPPIALIGGIIGIVYATTSSSSSSTTSKKSRKS